MTGLFGSSEEKKWRKELAENVYKKLYCYIFDLHKKNSPRGYPISNEIWSNIEPDVLLKMDKKLRIEFVTFSEEIGRAHV